MHTIQGNLGSFGFDELFFGLFWCSFLSSFPPTPNMTFFTIMMSEVTLENKCSTTTFTMQFFTISMISFLMIPQTLRRFETLSTISIFALYLMRRVNEQQVFCMQQICVWKKIVFNLQRTIVAQSRYFFIKKFTFLKVTSFLLRIFCNGIQSIFTTFESTIWILDGEFFSLPLFQPLQPPFQRLEALSFLSHSFFHFPCKVQSIP